MLEIMANTLSIPVVNAMTDEKHPCEIMSDLYTLSKIRTDYLRDNYLFVGADGNIGRAWKELMNMANENAILNPCPPFYRGEEVTEEVIDSDYFIGYEFKQSLLKVQQAIMIYCLSS